MQNHSIHVSGYVWAPTPVVCIDVAMRTWHARCWLLCAHDWTLSSVEDWHAPAQRMPDLAGPAQLNVSELNVGRAAHRNMGNSFRRGARAPCARLLQLPAGGPTCHPQIAGCHPQWSRTAEERVLASRCTAKGPAAALPIASPELGARSDPWPSAAVRARQPRVTGHGSRPRAARAALAHTTPPTAPAPPAPACHHRWVRVVIRASSGPAPGAARCLCSAVPSVHDEACRARGE